MISVIIPNYNNITFLKKTLESVFGQTEKNIEVILIDDGSSQKILQELEIILKSFENKVTLIKNKKNLGLAGALNKAISMSNGDFIARIDNDDEWIDSDKIKVQENYLKQNPSTVLIGTKYLFGPDSENNPDKAIMELNNEDIREVLLYKNPFCHSSVMFSRKHFDQVGRYNSNLKYTEDHDLWIRLSVIGNIEILPIESTFYRISNIGMSNKTNWGLKTYYRFRLFLKYQHIFKNKKTAIMKIISDTLGLYKIKKILK